MKKVLIICDVYPPSFAPRMGYLVKYMKELGWNADIVTRGLDGDYSYKSLLGDESVFRVNDISNPIKTLKDKVNRLVKQKQNYDKSGELIAQYILDNLDQKEYKMILGSTAHRTFILDAANKVAKIWKKPWIADIRDIYEQLPLKVSPYTRLKKIVIEGIKNNFIRHTIKQRNKSFKSANAITSVSPWHVQTIKKYNKSTYLIYNGYDPDCFYSRGVKNQNVFKIIYTGIVVTMEYQDPTMLFLAVKKLVIENIISKEMFRIQFYTPKNRRSSVLNNQAYMEVKEFVDFFDYVDTSEVPKVLDESSILLLLTNIFKPDGPKGIMTTKYFEYLAIERPILCVRSDENLLEESIIKANAGVSARTVEETYDFLLEKWGEWKSKGYTTINVNKDYTKQFSRKLQAKQFVDLFEKVIGVKE